MIMIENQTNILIPLFQYSSLMFCPSHLVFAPQLIGELIIFTTNNWAVQDHCKNRCEVPFLWFVLGLK